MRNFYLSSCISLLASALFANTYEVTTGSDNTSSPETGSYRLAIQNAEINESLNSIQITTLGSPVTLVGNMGDETTPHTTITDTINIESDIGGLTRIVNGNSFVALDVGRYGYVTISPDVVYQNSNVTVVDGILTLSNPQNYTALLESNRAILKTSTLMFLEGTGIFAPEISLTGREYMMVMGDVTLSGVISGTGAITKQGSGILGFAGRNAYTDGTILSEGKIVAGNDDAFGQGILEMGNGTVLSLSSDISLPNSIEIAGDAFIDVPTGGSTATISGSISSSGNLTKIGYGGLVLTNVNTYLGTTTILDGKLVLRGSGTLPATAVYVGDGSILDLLEVNSDITVASIEGKGAIILSSKSFTVGNSSSTVMSGPISGMGALMKQGTGTLTLSGTNSYSGDTTIGEGQILANHKSAFGTGIINIQDAAILGIGNVSMYNPVKLAGNSFVSVDLETGSLLGVISGSGALVKIGAGNLGLYAANTYAGGTHIEEGSITAYNSNGFGSGPVTWEEGTTFTYETGESILADIGAVEFNINQSLTLLNDQIIHGQLWVNAAEGVSASLYGDIQTGGDLSKHGMGTLFLFGDNRVDGAITLNEGSIGAGSNTAFGTSTVNAKDGTTILFNSVTIDNTIHMRREVRLFSDFYAEIRGQIIGDGCSTCIKTGSGTIRLSHELPIDVNYGVTYEGTLVLGGTSYVDWGIMAGSFLEFCPSGTNTGSIDVCGTLRGNLTNYGPIKVHAGGTISAGCSIGEINVSGPLTLQSGSKISIEVSNTGNDFYSVSETFEVGDQVEAQFVMLPGYNRIYDQFVFLEAGSITAPDGFKVVATTNPFLSATVTIAGNSVSVEIQKEQFANVIAEGNAARVGEAIDQVTSTGDLVLTPIISSLIALGNVNEVTQALNQMQPALFKGLAISQENNGVNIQEMLGYRMQTILDQAYCVQGSSLINFWIDGFGDALHQKSNVFANSQQFGYQSNSAGVVVGIDAHFANYFYAGALGGYTDTDTNYVNNQGSGGINTGYAGIYLSGISEMFYGNLSVIGGFSGYNGNRRIYYTGVDVTAVNNHNGEQIVAHIDTGISLGSKRLKIRPFDSCNYVVQTEDAYTESGAGLYNLNVAKSHTNLLRNELGVQFVGSVCVGQSSWTVSPKFSWVREVRTSGRNVTAEFINTNVEFKTTGYFPDRSLFSTGMIVSGSMLNDCLLIDLYYSGDFGTLYSDHNYGGQVRFGF